jgi:hypothetical protein
MSSYTLTGPLPLGDLDPKHLHRFIMEHLIKQSQCPNPKLLSVSELTLTKEYVLSMYQILNI